MLICSFHFHKQGNYHFSNKLFQRYFWNLIGAHDALVDLIVNTCVLRHHSHEQPVILGLIGVTVFIDILLYNSIFSRILNFSFCQKKHPYIICLEKRHIRAHHSGLQ